MSLINPMFRPMCRQPDLGSVIGLGEAVILVINSTSFRGSDTIPHYYSPLLLSLPLQVKKKSCAFVARYVATVQPSVAVSSV